MTSLGFWEATWPLRRFMTLTHQFLPLPTLWKRLFWFFTNASFVLITLLALVQLVVETYAKSITVLETTVVFLAIAETCFRLVYLNWNQRDIFHLMTRCERFPASSPSFVESEISLRENAARKIRSVLTKAAIVASVTLTVYLCLMLFFGVSSSQGDEMTIFYDNFFHLRVWLPWGKDVLQSLPWHITFIIWQTMSYITIGTVLAPVECLLYSFVIFLDEAMQHLQRTTPTKRVNTVQGQIRDGPQPTLLDEVKVMVEQHRYILEVAQELELQFSPIIFVAFLSRGIVITILSYMLLKVKEPVVIIFISGYLIRTLVKLYAMSYFGQILIDQSALLNKRMPLKVWSMSDGSSEDSDLRIISLYCKGDGIKLTGMKFFTLNIEAFWALCGLAIGYFVVLMQFVPKNYMSSK